MLSMDLYLVCQLKISVRALAEIILMLFLILADEFFRGTR